MPGESEINYENTIKGLQDLCHDYKQRLVRYEEKIRTLEKVNRSLNFETETLGYKVSCLNKLTNPVKVNYFL